MIVANGFRFGIASITEPRPCGNGYFLQLVWFTDGQVMQVNQRMYRDASGTLRYS